MDFTLFTYSQQQQQQQQQQQKKRKKKRDLSDNSKNRDEEVKRQREGSLEVSGSQTPTFPGNNIFEENLKSEYLKSVLKLQ